MTDSASPSFLPIPCCPGATRCSSSGPGPDAATHMLLMPLGARRLLSLAAVVSESTIPVSLPLFSLSCDYLVGLID